MCVITVNKKVNIYTNHCTICKHKGRCVSHSALWEMFTVRVSDYNWLWSNWCKDTQAHCSIVMTTDYCSIMHHHVTAVEQGCRLSVNQLLFWDFYRYSLQFNSWFQFQQSRHTISLDHNFNNLTWSTCYRPMSADWCWRWHRICRHPTCRSSRWVSCCRGGRMVCSRRYRPGGSAPPLSVSTC